MRHPARMSNNHRPVYLSVPESLLRMTFAVLSSIAKINSSAISTHGYFSGLPTAASSPHRSSWRTLYRLLEQYASTGKMLLQSPENSLHTHTCLVLTGLLYIIQSHFSRRVWEANYLELLWLYFYFTQPVASKHWSTWTSSVTTNSCSQTN